MRALVFGATGYTGLNVVKELVRRGHSVVAHLRPGSASGEAWSQRFSELGASAAPALWDAASIGRVVAVAEPQVVFVLIGTTRKRAAAEGLRAKDIYDEVDRALSVMALEAVREYAPLARFVYLSAVGVKPESQVAYIKARARVEAQLRDSGIGFTIARPSFITGPDREEERRLERVFAGAADAVLGLTSLFGLRSLREAYASMSGPELARALVEAALDERCRNVVLGVGELKRLAVRAQAAAPKSVG
jgi:uncharacterized protein YbjT (DUF2867 family)